MTVVQGVSTQPMLADPGAPAPLLSARVIAAALGQFPPTDEQTAVIEAPLAPALVVAGAGSGKTETMASRVVWLVANGIVRRDEVLGLTFTRKAAGELAERIQRRLTRLAEFERHGLLDALPALYAEGRLDDGGLLFSGRELAQCCRDHPRRQDGCRRRGNDCEGSRGSAHEALTAPIVWIRHRP